tara:strand:- start:491 stop:958 length:468 start_codon:yes stop_codon:yes gene_type:complete
MSYPAQIMQSYPSGQIHSTAQVYPTAAQGYTTAAQGYTTAAQGYAAQGYNASSPTEGLYSKLFNFAKIIIIVRIVLHAQKIITKIPTKENLYSLNNWFEFLKSLFFLFILFVIVYIMCFFKPGGNESTESLFSIFVPLKGQIEMIKKVVSCLIFC